ncbi:MAG: nitroreductase family protein [Pseudomonadota bacterium]
MPAPNPAALDFLLTRRSRPYKTLAAPAPDRAALEPILTAAMRTPDHGKLEPWRLIVLQAPALRRLSSLVATRGAALDKSEEDIVKAQQAYELSPLAVVVVEVQKPSAKIPAVEKTYAAGAACLALLNAALATGWGANWLSGWPSHDRTFCVDGLGLGADETVAGLIHIGTETSVPPDRPRPDLGAITSWVDA